MTKFLFKFVNLYFCYVVYALTVLYERKKVSEMQASKITVK